MTGVRAKGSKRAGPGCAWATVRILFSVFFGLAALQAHAGAQTLDVRLGFDGAFIGGRWTPLRVDLSTEAPFAGRIEIDVPRTTLLSLDPAYVTFEAEVALEPRSRRSLRLTVPLQAAPYPLYVRLLDAADRTVRAVESPLREAAAPGALVLVLDPSGDPWSWLSNVEASGPRVTVATARAAEELPSEALALSALAAIVVKDSFPLGSLDPEQVRALVDYLRFGGRLVLVGGSSPPDLPTALTEALPRAVTGRVVLLPIEAGAIAAWDIDPSPGAATEAVDGRTIVASYPVGAGRVTYVAADPSLQAFRSLLPGETWLGLIVETRLYPGTPATHQEEVWRILGRDRLDTPPPAALPALLGGYIVAVSSLFLVGSRRLRLLSIVPLVVVATSFLTWTFAKTELDRTAHRAVQVSFAIADGVALTSTYGLIASGSPRATAFSLSGPAPRPFPTAETGALVEAAVTAGGILIDDLAPGETIRYLHERIEALPIAVHLETDEVVRVTNGTAAPLRFAYIVSRDWFTPIGAIEPGATVTIPIPAGAAGSTGFISLSIQSHLDRTDAPDRPGTVDTRLIAATVSRALEDPFLAGRRGAPILVALTDPSRDIDVNSTGFERWSRIVVAPAVERN